MECSKGADPDPQIMFRQSPRPLTASRIHTPGILGFVGRGLRVSDSLCQKMTGRSEVEKALLSDGEREEELPEF